MNDRPQPVLNRAFFAAVLQLLVLAGVAIPADLGNALVDVAVILVPPIITAVAAFLASSKVTPIEDPQIPFDVERVDRYVRRS